MAKKHINRSRIVEESKKRILKVFVIQFQVKKMISMKHLTIFMIFSFIFETICGQLTAQQMFGNYKNRFQLSFQTPEEEFTAYDNFQENLNFISHHNSENVSFTVSVNPLAHYVRKIF